MPEEHHTDNLSAATTMESRVEAAIAALLEAGEVPEYGRVEAQVMPTPKIPAPQVHGEHPISNVRRWPYEDELRLPTFRLRGQSEKQKLRARAYNAS